MLGLAEMSTRVPGLGQWGELIGGAVGGIFKGAESAVPIAAAFGHKPAVRYEQQKNALKCAEQGGDWTGEYCDLTAIHAQQHAQKLAEAKTGQIQAIAPWVAIGVGGIALAWALGGVVMKKSEGKK